MNPDIAVASQVKTEDADYSIVKLVSLSVIAVLSSFFMMFELSNFVASFNSVHLWFTALAALIFFVVNILNVFFVKHRSVLAGIIAAETFAPLLLFLTRITSIWAPLILGLSIFFLFVYFSIIAGKRFLENSIQIEFFSVTKVVTPRLVTGALIGMGLVFYLQCFGAQNTCSANLGKKLVDQALNASRPIVNLWVPNVHPDQKVSEVFRAYTIAEVKAIPFEGKSIPVNLGAETSDLTTETKERIIQSVSEQLQSTIEQQVGPINKDATVRSEVQRLVGDYANRFPPNIKVLFSIGLTVLLFFSVKALAFLFYWFVNLLAFLVYKLLLSTGFALLANEIRTREFIILP